MTGERAERAVSKYVFRDFTFLNIMSGKEFIADANLLTKKLIRNTDNITMRKRKSDDVFLFR
jgi:hypothetical protein